MLVARLHIACFGVWGRGPEAVNVLRECVKFKGLVGAALIISASRGEGGGPESVKK